MDTSGGPSDGGLNDGGLSDGGLSDGGLSDGGLNDAVEPSAVEPRAAQPAPPMPAEPLAPPVAPAGQPLPPTASQSMPPPSGPPIAAPVGEAGALRAEDRQMAMFAHLGQLLGAVSGIGGFVVPLIIMLTKGKENDFVRRAAVESLNFWITGFIATIVAGLTLLILVGFLLLPIVLLFWFVMPIVAGVKVNDGTDYRYPFAIRILT